jgi:tetraacyldisaccharide 4'-kinase
VWETLFLEIIAGKKTWWASVLRVCFLVLSWFYEWGVRLRNLAFDTNMRATRKLSAPVISVGNLSVGGTGKTPLVAWVIKAILAQNAKPGIVSRGYRRVEGQEGNDEYLLLTRLCPNVPHAQNPDRFAAAHTLITKEKCDVIVMDDGFQHRQLHRDLNIVLLDASRPLVLNQILPRGLLREPFDGLKRADLVILTRTQIAPELTAQLRSDTLRYVSAEKILEVEFEPISLIDQTQKVWPLSIIKGQKSAFFCGIGHPGGFKKTIEKLGIMHDPELFRVFEDHYRYTTSDQEQLEEWASQSGCHVLITTEKDLVKFPSSTGSTCEVYALRVEPVFLSGEAILQDKIRSLLVEFPGATGLNTPGKISS